MLLTRFGIMLKLIVYIIGSFVCKRRSHLQAKLMLIQTVMKKKLQFLLVLCKQNLNFGASKI